MRALAFALVLLAAPAFAQEEEMSVLPDGEGREETFAMCTACHNTAIIRRTRLPRPQWDGLMDWMVEKHGMNPLDADMRVVIVDYLTRHFGPAATPPRARNPFL